MHQHLTYPEIIAKCKEFYPECCGYGQHIDMLARVESKLVRLSKCDDLTKTEKWKVEVLLPNIQECLA